MGGLFSKPQPLKKFEDVVLAERTKGDYTCRMYLQPTGISFSIKHVIGDYLTAGDILADKEVINKLVRKTFKKWLENG